MNKRTGLETRVWNALSAGTVMVALLGGCAVTPSTVRDLPELPPEFARDLAIARTAPVLMTESATTVAPLEPRPAGPTVLLAPSKACTAIFDGYVLFPITVCYPPPVFYDALILDAAAAPVVGNTLVPPVKYFKLTSHPLTSVVRLPWFCSVRSGPWYAHVEGQQICNTNPNIRQFKAELLGAPEPVVVVWSGALSDVPPPLNLFGIQQTGEFCTCCSGFMCPDGSCKPNPNQCSIGPPAVKQ